MRRLIVITAGIVLFMSFLFLEVSSPMAQTEEERRFIKSHQKELTTFMEKCSGCHSLQRIFAKQRSKEEWNRILNQMAGKPHSMINQEELQQIQKWIDFMQSTFTVGP